MSDIFDVLLPQQKELSFDYKDLHVTFTYNEPTIEKELLISAKRKELAKAFGIPLEEVDKEDSPYKNEIIIINVLSRLFYTISDIKINGEEFPIEKLAQIKDIDLLFRFFNAITE